jgi:integrase
MHDLVVVDPAAELLRPYAVAAGVPGIAPHGPRRSCAKLCRAAGGELEQIQLLLGHATQRFRITEVPVILCDEWSAAAREARRAGV